MRYFRRSPQAPGGSRAPACRCLGHGRRYREMLSAPLRRRECQRWKRRKLLPGHGQCLSLREGYRGPGVPGGTAKPSPTGPAGRPRSVRCPWPGCRPGPRESPRIRGGGGPVPTALRSRARHSPSMSLVTVLKCIFCGRQPGRAGALRPPRRSSSAPFPACSAAATEIREAILKAFALGDRGLFSSIGETPMQEQQARQPPTTSPPSHPLTPLLSTAPSREVRTGPPPSRRGGGEGKLKKKKKIQQKTT